MTSHRSERRSARPNLLLVVLDRLRCDSVGLTSSGRVRTPNLDALAARGTFFDHAYSHLPTCCPARQSLLTGQRPETLGTLWNFDGAPPIPALSGDAATWSRALSQAGYRTSYFGKWHVHPDLGPEAFGYERYVPYTAHAQYFRDKHPGVEPATDWFGEVLPVPAADCPPAWFAGQVSEEISRLNVGTEPWHVRLDLSEPHLPCRPSAEFAERYRADDLAPWGSFAEDFANKPYIQ